MTKRYIGRRGQGGTLTVTVDDAGGGKEAERRLDPRFDLRRHSPDGFECGYGGSGPAQLSLALLADCMGEEFALGYYQAYKSAVVAGLPQDADWVLGAAEVMEVARGIAEQGE